MKILIIKILPRGRDWKGLKAAREETNDLLDQVALKNNWKLLDVGSAVSCGYSQPCADYAQDLLHISVKGYPILTERVANAIRQFITSVPGGPEILLTTPPAHRQRLAKN